MYVFHSEARDNLTVISPSIGPMVSCLDVLNSYLSDSIRKDKSKTSLSSMLKHRDLNHRKIFHHKKLFQRLQKAIRKYGSRWCKYKHLYLHQTKNPLKRGPDVSPIGFEPMTASLEGRCSIQLSYEPV
jgi:hypothetical protein